MSTLQVTHSKSLIRQAGDLYTPTVTDRFDHPLYAGYHDCIAQIKSGG